MFGPLMEVLKIPVPPWAKFMPYCILDEFLNAYGVGDSIFRKEAAMNMISVKINTSQNEHISYNNNAHRLNLYSKVWCYCNVVSTFG